MFKRRKLPPGYTIEARVLKYAQGPGDANTLVLFHPQRHSLAAFEVGGYGSSARSVFRKLRGIAWADHEGRGK